MASLTLLAQKLVKASAGKLTRYDASELAKAALADGKVTSAEKKTLGNIAKRYQDGFDGGKAALAGFVADPSILPTPFEVLHTEPFSPDTVGDRAVQVIASAKSTIDVAVYEIQDPRIIDALKAAAARGVKIRIVTDDSYFRDEETLPILQNRVAVKGEATDIYNTLTGFDPDKNPGRLDQIKAQLLALQPKMDALPAKERIDLSAALAYIAAPKDPAAIARLKSTRLTASTSVRFDTVRLKFRPALDSLLALGVAMRDDQKTTKSHNKFMVVDREIVWAGSYNWQGLLSDEGVSTGTPMTADNAVVFDDKTLAATFEEEFDQMMVDGHFGKDKHPVTGGHSSVVAGVPVTAYFAPEDPIPAKIAESLEALVASGAKPTIRMAAYVLNYRGCERIVDALIALKAQGADVKLVMDMQAAKKLESAYWRLTTNGVPVEIAEHAVMMHDKFISVQNGTTGFVWTGSANFTGPAYGENDESVLRIDDLSIAQEYARIFATVEKHLQPQALPA